MRYEVNAFLLYFLESILDAEMQNEIRSNLRSVVSDVLIPPVMRTIGTNDMEVDRQRQAALVQLIEQNFISKAQIEIQVCPSILALSKGETEEDLNANAGAITVSIYFIAIKTFLDNACFALMSHDLEDICSVKDMGSEMFRIFLSHYLVFHEEFVIATSIFLFVFPHYSSRL